MSRSSLINFTCLEQSGCYIEYSQGNRGTHDIIKKSPLTADGICQALSAKWIAQHANDDSLWNWLFIKGTRSINQAAIVNLMHNFTDGVARHGKSANPTSKNKYPLGMTYQDYVTERYMAIYGVQRRKMVQKGFLGNQFHLIATGADGHCLAHRMQGSFLNSRGDSYVLIVIKGKDKNKPVGHAMSAYVGSEDFVFFDPNFGEFWFPSHEKFQAWFKGYWSTSGYNRVFDGFYLLPYGKGI